MEVYFFRHGFDAQRTGRDAPIPGRYMFTVEARSLERDGDRLAPRAPSEHRVCIDGFEEEGPGSNVDPNVLSDRLPWFLSYCNAGKAVLDLNGRPVGSFPDVVRRGDVIVFGAVIGTEALAIDTVLCARELIPLPTLGGEFALERRFGAYWNDCVAAGLADLLTWEEFVRTADFVMNLADSMPAPRRAADSPRAAELLGHRRQVFHAKPSVPMPLQLLGTRCRVLDSATVEAVQEMFAVGSGFDFIPLGVGARPSTAMVMRRPGLLTVGYARADQLTHTSVSRLPRTDGLAVLGAIIGTADRLVVGRLRWLKARRFSHFERSQRPNKLDPSKQVEEVGPRYVDVPRARTI